MPEIPLTLETPVASGRRLPLLAARIARRTAAALILLIATAYATIPWWLPPRWIADRVAGELSRALQRPVTIGAASLDWVDGVVLREVTLGTPEASENYLGSIREIRCGLDPIRTLATGRVHELRILQPQFHLIVDDHGRILNLQGLGNASGDPGGELPSHHLEVRDAACHVVRGGERRTFGLDLLRCDLDEPAGILRVLGAATIARPGQPETDPRGRYMLDAHIQVARLRKDRTLGGRVRLEWADLALSDLPLALFPQLPVAQVDGTTSGELTLAPQRDLDVDFDLFIDLNGVRVLRAGSSEPEQAPDAEVRATGKWDPKTDVLVLSDLQYETSAVRVRRAQASDAPALRIEHRGESPFELHLEGTIKAWERLGEEFPEIAAFGRAAGIEMTGPADFELTLRQSRGQDLYELRFDAGESSCIVHAGETEGATLSLPAGVDKSLEVLVLHDRAAGRLSAPLLKLVLGQFATTVQFSAPLPRPDHKDGIDWLLAALPEMSAMFAVETASAADLLKLAPILRRAGVHELSGGLRAGVSLEPDDAGLKVLAEFTAEAPAAINYGDQFVKAVGSPLELAAGFRLNRSTLQVDRPELRVVHGEGRIELDSGRSSVRYHVAGPPAGDATSWLRADLHLAMQSVETLTSLLPAWGLRAPGGRTVASGDARAQFTFDYAQAAGERLALTRFRVDAEPLDLHIPDVVIKPAGDEMSIEFAHRLQTVGDRREQAGSLSFRNDAGRIDARLAFSGVDADGRMDSFETLTFTGALHDIERTVRHFPRLADAVRTAGARGPVRFSLAERVSGDRVRLELDADATNAAMVLGGIEPFRKPAGMPVRFHFVGEAGPEDGESDKAVWTLRDVHAEFAGLSIDTLAGRITTHWPGYGLGSRLMRRERVMPRLAGLELETSGQIHCDTQTARLHPAIESIIRELNLAGTCGYRVRLGARGDTLHAAGSIDGTGLRFSRELPLADLPLIRKREGVVASASFDVQAQRRETAGTYDVQISSATLALQNNRIETSGELRVERDGESARVSAAWLRSRFELPELREITTVLPGSNFTPVDGAAHGSVHVRGPLDDLRVESAQLRLERLAVRTPADQIHLHGNVFVDGSRVEAQNLRWGWGASAGRIDGVFDRQDERNRARFDIDLRMLDYADFLRRLDQLMPPPPAQRPGADPNEQLRSVFAELARSDVLVRAAAQSLVFPLPLGVNVNVEGCVMRTRVVDGQLELAFEATVDGGAVSGTLRADTADLNKPFHLAYTANKIQPGALVDQYLGITFPGMKATGALTIIDETYQKFIAALGEPNGAVGKGELIIDGGYVEGRAAPIWLTRIFPGLNLARFDFSYMHSWFDKTIDGRIRHSMIYKGQFYNCYMTGYSDAENNIDYEVGIDFLADFDSKYWAETGQGRIPLFRKTGRKLPDGTLADETVTFTPPERILEVLAVKNNPIVTAYHAVRKRVLRAQ